MSQLPSSSSSTGMDASIWVADDGTFHEDYKGLVFIGSDFLGEFSLDAGSHPELRYRRTGVAYFCHTCGEVWARIVLVDSRGEQKSFEPRSVACRTHYDQWNIPGSLLAGELFGLIEVLPPEALRREVAIHFNYYNGG